MHFKVYPLLFCFLLLFLVENSIAQAPGKNGFSVALVGVDHLSPLDGQTANYFEDITGAGSLTYHRWLADVFNLAVPLRFGVARLPKEDLSLGPRRSFLSLDITGQWHPFIQRSRFSPYLHAGIGGFLDHTNSINPQVPAGLGINFRLRPGGFIQVQSEYRTDFKDLRNNFMHSLGVMITLGDSPKPEEPEELPPPDRDGDGISDTDDKCPDIAGLAAFSGCPDTDGDGIADPDDGCPTQAGPLENSGCPLADADGDGIVDAEDQCPQLAGPASTAGCPDSDGDGVIDPADKCPNTAGPADNNGCPKIEDTVIETLDFVAQNIQFETGKAQLKPVSFAILDKVVVILNQYPNYSVAIAGHTDSIGGADINQLLSERRAKSCYEYLVIKGIKPGRMSYVGYGETRPIADNRYKDGREQNRRVEFNLFLK